MNVMSCHGLLKSPISTVILTYPSALVPNYLNKVSVVVETEEGGPYNIPITIKEQINDVNLHNEDILLKCKAAIP